MRHPWRIGTVALLLIGSAITTAGASPAHSSPDAAAKSSTHSTVVTGQFDANILFLDGDEEEVKRFVPQTFAMLPGAGHVDLVVDATFFRNLVLDGRRIPDFVRSELFAVMAPGPGEPETLPIETYSVWFLANDRGIVDGLANAGLGCRSRATYLCDVPDLTVSTTQDARGMTSVTMKVPWEFSPYTLSASFPSSKINGVGFFPSQRHWYSGARGLVPERVAFSDHSAIAGSGVVRPQPDSPLYRMLGRQTDATGYAVSWRANFKATFTI